MDTETIEITSDTAAVVAGIHVRVGEGVAANQLLVTTELMKMRREFRAPSSGTIAAVAVDEGDVIEPGAVLVRLDPADGVGPETEADTVAAGPRRSLEEMRSMHAALEDTARPEAVARRREKGLRTARENVADLFDAGSFVEYGALALAAQRRKHEPDVLRRRSPADGIVTGFGAVNAAHFGRERAACAVMAVDYTVMAGTQGWFHHKKIDRLLGVVEENPVPVVVFAEGGGGRPNDVDVQDLSFSGLDVPSFWKFARLSGKAPRVAIVEGRCFAGNAAFAATADVVIATERSNLGMGGPAMIEGGGLGRFAPESIGPADVQWKNGVIDVLVKDEAEAVAAAKRYLGYFQGPLAEWTAPDQTRLREVVPEDRQLAYDIREAIRLIADGDSVLELRGGYGAGMITALARIEGRPLGLIANNPLHLGGAVDPDAAGKAARFLQLCDTFGLPVVSLCDTPGFMVGPDTEALAQVRHAGRIFLAGAHFSGTLCTVVLRKGYGLGAQAMAGGSFHRSAFTVAWPTGEIGAMGLEGAIRLGARAELEAIEDEAERAALFEKLLARAYQRGKAASAAALVEFDAVIDPADTRKWILSAFAAGGRPRGGRGYVDAW